MLHIWRHHLNKRLHKPIVTVLELVILVIFKGLVILVVTYLRLYQRDTMVNMAGEFEQLEATGDHFVVSHEIFKPKVRVVFGWLQRPLDCSFCPIRQIICLSVNK